MIIDLDQRRALARRVVVRAFYTDGLDLYETESIGATGCVTLRDCRETERIRCLSIQDFRSALWLVAGEARRAA